MVKTAAVEQEPLFTPEQLAEICESSPARKRYREANAKETELKTKLSVILQQKEDLRVEWTTYSKSKAQEKIDADYAHYLDSGTVPTYPGKLELLQARSNNLRDEETLIRGALELQKWRVMEAHNAFKSSVGPQLKALHRSNYRRILESGFRLQQEIREILRIPETARRFELDEQIFACGIPWANYMGRPDDPYSGFQVWIRDLRDGGWLSHDEYKKLLAGGEFTA